MSVAELAKKLGISRQWLNKMVDRGMVPGVSRSEVNGRLVVDEAKLERLLFTKPFRESHLQLRESFRRIQSVPSQKKRDLSRTMRTVKLMSRLFSVEIEEQEPDLYSAFNLLPFGDGLKLLRTSKRFSKFKEFPLIEWAVLARTEKSFEIRCALVEFKYARNPDEFHDQTDIAERFAVTRSAVSKTSRLMPAIKRSSERRSRSTKRTAA